MRGGELMGEQTAISWCQHTFNPWVGCQKISPACDGCYAARLMDERLHRVEFGGPGKGVGTRSLTSEANWKEPLRWNRQAAALGIYPFVFGGSLMDPFDKHVPARWRRRYFDEVIRPTKHLVWLLLTKRPQLIIDLSEEAGGLPENVALGTTAEDQERWDQNIGDLVNAKAMTGARFAFASCEPLLGPINPRKARVTRSMMRHFTWSASGHEWFDPIHPRQDPRFKLDWIITGGETDQGAHKARPWNPQWARDIRDDCEATGTPFHHKQNGEWVSVSEVEGFGGEEFFTFDDGRTVRKVGRRHSGRAIDGVVHDAFPDSTRRH